ncbi:hypothetical protein FZ934_14800 [Rhizobium grahamii]|uniref:Uncharacterized protein n=1 Tax=Rhizobium grahamii TaxID=1120045 RepID=A0A5Q0C6K1_9HYPH|nr:MULTISPECIES: hypothetical protein [Rhizobium]QFY61556.1 hypothetical protein FZ934_14800 [Rhizobium grahamii]QRM49287.1 hypothetical protein F3Y33_08090 [Rhizobium sp. BG6]
MPHQIKDAAQRKLAFRGYPKVLLDRPKLAALIGAMAANWGEIDETIKFLFGAAAHSDHQNGGLTIDPIAGVVFGSIEHLGLATRLDVIKAIIPCRLGREYVAEFSDIAAEIRKRNPERNDVIHASWNICDEYPDDLILLRDGQPYRYTFADLNDRLERAVATRNRLWDFAIKVANAPKIAIK